MSPSRFHRLWRGVSAVWLLAGGAVLAHAGDRSDHERARAALQAGEVMPLHRVLEGVRRTHPGDVLEVELERENGRWVYEIKLLQRGGQLVRLEVDAGTAEVLRIRQRSRPEGQSSGRSGNDKER